MMPEIIGPRQMTAAFSFGTIRLVETTLMPDAVTEGKMPWSEPRNPPTGRPKSFGMLGPVISASRMPTFLPARVSSHASMAVIEDLPTPPFPLKTAITFSTLLNLFSLGSSGLPLEKMAFFSSSLMVPKVIFTSVAPGMARIAIRASRSIWFFIGQPGMVSARVKETSPASVIFRSLTMFNSTMLRPSSGSCTFFSVSMIWSLVNMALLICEAYFTRKG